jgi:hypothetical protein
MDVPHELGKLCESWWDKLADSTKGEQHRFAEEFLRILGWTAAVRINTDKLPVQHATTSYVLRGGGQAALAAHFVMPGSLDPPSSLIERGLDFCETTRLIVNATRSIHVNYAFISDLFRAYLYDARTDELLLTADSTQDLNKLFLTALARPDVERGSLEEVRRQPRSFTARQLRDWCHHWCDTIAAQGGLSKDTAFLAIDRLLVIRYLFDHDILKRPGWILKKRFGDLIALAFSPNHHGIGRDLTRLFHDLWFDWRADIFAVDPALDDILEQDAIAAPLLREFALLSRSKFSIATILESFNFGEAAEKARVRMVPDTDETREMQLARQKVNTVDQVHIELDVQEEGYRAIFYWFDRLVSLYERLGVEFEASHRRIQDLPPDMDLFQWSELDAHRPGALKDKFSHAIEHGFVLYYATPRQFRTARLLLYLHLISRYDHCKLRFTQFPDMTKALQKRPAMLDKDRRRLYEGSAGGDGWEVY